MATLFVADIHLSVQEPAITAGFLHFLRRQAAHADALYILGDLFEAWIGDDDPAPLHDEIAAALNALAQRGVPCFFIHGNRDFLLGKDFARACGMTLLPEERLLTLYDRPILILHGDTLCTDDLAYQRYRRRVNQRWLQRLFLALPLKWRLRIAGRMRADSQRANGAKSQTIMDVSPQAVVATLERYQAQWMIHGHTHRPAIHTLDIRGGSAHRAVLGAWHHQGSMVRVTRDSVELIEFPYN
ncbi:UDP-2,3-diacylglucosamine diphosphatase [Acerihabitans arboris]|uniref:UDP-2,3-diacylglucosamine hydrolase n=1 Tax=Acerihabitans arboris TaxID=2691583 RepID=A0A845SM37_9GAMM|nr:UDP-2,3-diacylglucosamine diphosphatase [Acerihabitans arboris]NDL65059.1 UDP-2,3-diacylglucosamine diphosphatase [Acerihabitans arboris]